METLILITLTSLFTVVFNYTIRNAFEFLVRLFFSIVEVESPKGVRDIDRYLVETCPKKDVNLTSNTKPTNTFHLRRVGWFGLAIYLRDTSYRSHNNVHDYYIIYATPGVLEKINSKLSLFHDSLSVDEKKMEKSAEKEELKKVRLKISDVESSTPYNGTFTTECREMFFSVPFVWQKECLQMISESENQKSILLCGRQGLGKTSLSFFLGEKLNAQIILGYNLTSLGTTLNNLWSLSPSISQPVILVLDEIETAFAYATRVPMVKDKFRCLAEDKASLNTLFDRFERTPGLYIVATTNISFNEIYTQYPSFVRRGRFDLCFTLSEGGCKLEENF